jgi:hypothetical protein
LPILLFATINKRLQATNINSANRIFIFLFYRQRNQCRHFSKVALFYKSKVKNLNDILPIFSVDKDLILSKMGDITIGVSCELPEIFTLSSDEFEAFHQAWVKAIKLLPVGCILYKQDWFMEEKFKADFSGDKSFLSRSSERFFNERPYLDHRCYLFLTRKPRGRVQPNSMFSTLLRKHIVPDEILDQSFLAEFISVVGQFEKILFDSGFIKLHRLRDEALNKVISQYWNLGSDG